MEVVTIFISEGPKHGKTEARKRLSEALGIRGMSCSDVIIEEYCKSNNLSEVEVRANKDEHRAALIRKGDSLCRLNPDALVMGCFRRGALIIDGARREEELTCAKKKLRTLGYLPVVIYVHRRKLVCQRDNTTVTRDHADAVFSFGEINKWNAWWYTAKLLLVTMIATIRA